MDLLAFLRLQWDRVAAWAAAAVGAVVLLLGYHGISTTPHVAEQLPYLISAGLTGIFLLGIAGMLWVSADMRDEWRELHAIRVALEQARPAAAEATATAIEPAANAALSHNGDASHSPTATNGTSRRPRRPVTARSQQ